MPVFASYRLVPRGPWHVAERGVGIEETAESVHSDTLFSALCCAVRLGWGETELSRLLEPFRAGDPPFLLASLFPYAGDVRFLPKPQLPLPLDTPGEALKRVRQVRWISLELFRSWLAGSLEADVLQPEAFLTEQAAWLSPRERRALPASFLSEGRPLWARTVVPRVALDRVTNASQVYRAGRLLFGPDAGFHLLVAWRDDSWRTLVEAALRELGELGLGGLRSTGHGQFQLERTDPIEIPAPAVVGRLVLLSLYAPTRAELERGVLGSAARYDLVVRGGWIASPDGTSYRRKEVRLLSEGSVVAALPDQEVLGQLVDVTPDIMRTTHPVYRYGFALTVPATGKE